MPMTDMAAAAEPTAPKSITTKHLAYELAEQHQLTKQQGLEPSLQPQSRRTSG
jgi:hypothetical protein